MRESWTDERLDDGFDRVTGDIQSLREETSTLRREMNGRFEHLEGRFDDLQRTLMQVGGGMIAALLGVIATQL